MIFINVGWLIITIFCVYVTHRAAQSSYLKVGRLYGIVEAKMEIFELVKKTGAVHCYEVKDGNRKHLFEVKAFAVDFVFKPTNTYELCIWE